LETHLHLPFHKVNKWNGKFFEKTSLHALGYVIHLGHAGHSCPNTSSTPGFHTTLVILNTNGIFTHCILWCECDNAPSSFFQLFKTGFFPSSFKKPQTAFTFDLLDYVYIDSMECKTAALSFCQKLAHITDNSFPGEVKVRQSVLSLATVQYTDFEVLKESLFRTHEGFKAMERSCQ
jgi:hypothetical protein